MEFLTDNYIWIIAIIVVILMTIIGYIAEKTNFGKKEFSKRKDDKKEVPREEVKKTVEKEPVQQTVVAPTAEMKPTEKTVAVEPNPVRERPVVEHEDVQFSDPLVDDMEVASDVLDTPYQSTEEVVPIEEDLNAPFGETVSYREPVETTAEVSEDLSAPFGDYEISNATNQMEEDLNAPFGDETSYPTREEFNLDLPDIDSIKEDVETVNNSENDDDDIWKF